MRWQQEEAPEFVEGRTDYTKREKELMADEFLRKDSRRELCRECDNYGVETGSIKSEPLYDKDDAPVIDDDGEQVFC